MNKHIFNDILTLKRQILPNDKVILFGSQARGDARPDSDWDLLVLLNKQKKEFDDYGNFAYPFDEIGFSYGVAINPIIYTNEQWEKRKITPFYKNVMNDGIEIK
ncbi:MAG: nucleotidyltransferase domain-containing protein [Prevotellaceae bacterium]|jgi:predicted nucleotidyltransferase|nr:nucleotidyltransferase domain-containing protein [Prevotellaceae bacterium]